jgi:hypothetical protein
LLNQSLKNCATLCFIKDEKCSLKSKFFIGLYIHMIFTRLWTKVKSWNPCKCLFFINYMVGYKPLLISAIVNNWCLFSK